MHCSPKQKRDCRRIESEYKRLIGHIKIFLPKPENIMICSYNVMKTKNIYLLSSTHHEAASDNDDSKRRLEVISFYNTTKGGFETADKMLWGYLSKAASRR